jgi:hypothetical protein
LKLGTPVAGVVQDRLVDLRILGLRVQPGRDAAAPVDLERVHAPGGQRVDVLLVAPVGATLDAATGRSGVRVHAELEAVLV